MDLFDYMRSNAMEKEAYPLPPPGQRRSHVQHYGKLRQL